MEKAQVVIQTAFLGDLILSIPFLKRVKQLAPSEKLILVCKKGLGSFLQHQGVIDGFYEIAKGNRESYQEAREYLNQFEITHLFCVHRSVRSLLFARQLNAKNKIGFRSLLGFLFLHESYKYEKSWPDAIRKFRLLAGLDKEVREVLNNKDFSSLNMADEFGKMPSIPALFSFKRLFKGPRLTTQKQVCVFPGSVWATKRWTEEGFTEVVHGLLEKKYKVLLLGGAEERSLCETIAAQVSSRMKVDTSSITFTNTDIEVLAGKLTIQQSIEKVGESDLVIANDSAATHMAALQSTPAITLFGPTTLDLGFRPWSDLARVVQIDLSCRPCGAHGHQQCPLGHHHCMKWIKPEMVLAQALSILQN